MIAKVVGPAAVARLDDIEKKDERVAVKAFYVARVLEIWRPVSRGNGVNLMCLQK